MGSIGGMPSWNRLRAGLLALFAVAAGSGCIDDQTESRELVSACRFDDLGLICKFGTSCSMPPGVTVAPLGTAIFQGFTTGVLRIPLGYLSESAHSTLLVGGFSPMADAKIGPAEGLTIRFDGVPAQCGVDTTTDLSFSCEVPAGTSVLEVEYEATDAVPPQELGMFLQELVCTGWEVPWQG